MKEEKGLAQWRELLLEVAGGVFSGLNYISSFGAFLSKLVGFFVAKNM